MIRPPSDKSITHRSFIAAALAHENKSLIRSPLLSEDTLNTLNCLKFLGAKIHESKEGIEIKPIQNWKSPREVLYCGNSGTTMRLLAGVVAGHPIETHFIGDDSLNQRPMKRIMDPLRLMGAEIDDIFPPLKIRGSSLKAIDYISPIASAQVKSCILLAGLTAEGTIYFTEPFQSRDHTERLFQELGIILGYEKEKIVMQGGQIWNGFEHTVPGDFSSASYWILAAVLLLGSRLEIKDVNLNPTRTGMLSILEQCGANIFIHNVRKWMGEPVGDLTIEGGLIGKPFKVEPFMVPSLIDEVPLLALLASQCHGISKIKGLGELKVKESNRLDSIYKNLLRMGVKIEYLENSLIIYGPCDLYGAIIEVIEDHRIGMTFTIAGLLTKNKAITVIENANTISTSYPSFTEHLKQVVHF